ncbi:hypothetical protein PFICI_14213 [Pestalotiopsis fici W106-1]|uniref:DUF7791 domain-containing protein n=1 Tax=Pestalotiopsis fici (strain W106-1 / CGMCC3.15140) TaxID=1229662 RepID=W3WMH6_PESFW|nr:uncharacterized protein PFICI_14213 [Pestalotiopsis fici W106-1]ETS74347.1 hypothetical protein PFICI_14213 [Pestalotiopsis fici W106-1]
MPTELSEYFKSIWKRLGDDGKRYKTKAANIFLLLLSYGAFEDHFLVNGGLDCLSLSLALTPDTAHTLIIGVDNIRLASLLEMSQRAEKMVLSHCAGLVELLDLVEGPFEDCVYSRAQVTSATRECRSIHRTARDFFADTPEGKDLLDSNNIGVDGPDFHLVQAFLARSVAFRKSEHTGFPSMALRSIDIIDFFRLLGSSRFTIQQRYFLIDLCHKVFYRFSGHPGNPFFEGWTVVESFHHIRPFISEAACWGHSDYAAQLMKDQAIGGRIFSPEACDMVLKESLMGGISYRANTNSLSFASLLTFDSMFGSADKLNIRLPLACFGRHKGYAAEVASSRNIYSTSQMILGVVLVAYHRGWTMDRHGGENILYLLKSLATPDERLLENILCICSLSYVTPEFAVVKFHFPFMIMPGTKGASGWGGDQQEGVHLVFETSPLWLIQYLNKKNVWRDTRESVIFSHGLKEFVRLHDQSGRRLQKPRPILLFEYTDSMTLMGSEHTMIPMPTELKRVPPEAGRDLSEILGMLYDDDQEDVSYALWDRAWGVWTDPSTERIGTERVEEILEDHGILCSEEEKRRLLAMCNIQAWREGADSPEETQGRFVVPPKGASKEQEALSHLTMRFVR